jgi:hypothetical protein
LEAAPEATVVASMTLDRLAAPDRFGSAIPGPVQV